MIDSPIYSFLKKWGIENLRYLVDKKDMLGQRSFVETVCLLSKRKGDSYVKLEDEEIPLAVLYRVLAGPVKKDKQVRDMYKNLSGGQNR